jgi:hypothetical protein
LAEVAVAIAPALSAPALPAAQIAPAVAAVAGAEAVVPTSVVNPLIDVSNPAIAAAIAAYHMVDGIFDTAWPHDEGVPPEPVSYSETRPIAQVRPVTLDLNV